MTNARHKGARAGAAGHDPEEIDMAPAKDAAGLATARERLQEAAPHLPLTAQEMAQFLDDGIAFVQGLRVSLNLLEQFGIASDYDAFLAVQLPEVRADDADAMGMLLACSIGAQVSMGCGFARDGDGHVVAFQPVCLRQTDGGLLATQLLRLVAFSRAMGRQAVVTH